MGSLTKGHGKSGEKEKGTWRLRSILPPEDLNSGNWDHDTVQNDG